MPNGGGRPSTASTTTRSTASTGSGGSCPAITRPSGGPPTATSRRSLSPRPNPSERPPDQRRRPVCNPLVMTSQQRDLLIRGGAVVDGTGRPRYDGDVRVRNGRIVEIGPSLAPEGEIELDP